jgi:hypothetical protein
MVFIDSSSPYVSYPTAPAWEFDIDRWYELVSTYGYPKWGAAACDVAAHGPIMRPDYDVPNGITYRDVDRWSRFRGRKSVS